MKPHKNSTEGINVNKCIYAFIAVSILSLFSLKEGLGISAYLFKLYLSTACSFWLIHKIEASDNLHLPNNIFTRHLRMIAFLSLAIIFLAGDLHMFLYTCVLYLVVCAIGIIICFLPTIIAYCRKADSGSLIFLLNLLMGWTIIGWVAAFIWSAIDKPKAIKSN